MTSKHKKGNSFSIHLVFGVCSVLLSVCFTARGPACVAELTPRSPERDLRLCLQGGFSTRNEMCLAFITYFPRSPLTFCTSKPHIGEFLHSMDVGAVSVGGISMP